MKALDSSERVANQSDPSQVAHPLTGIQVLLVEDTPDQQHLYLRFLQQTGAEVTLECNGKAAVDAIAKSLTRFDAVVMDFMMPGLDGIDATRKLRELGYDGAIIAMSARGSEELKQSWLHAGCNEYLKKPMKRLQLITAIQLHTTGGKRAA